MSTDQTRSALAAVAKQLAGDGGLLADALLGDDTLEISAEDPGLGALAASGPRALGREEEIAIVVEAVYEGFLLHGGSSRVLDATDEDLNILAGDRLYALGLARLAAVGDLESVRELADVIAICAQARAIGDDRLAAAAWQLAASAIGWGPNAESDASKLMLTDGAGAATGGLATAALKLRGDDAHGDRP